MSSLSLACLNTNVVSFLEKKKKINAKAKSSYLLKHPTFLLLINTKFRKNHSI